MTSALAQVWWLAWADLRVEYRHRVSWVGAAGFGLLLLLLFSLTVSAEMLRRPQAVATLLWLALTVATLLVAARRAEVDVEDGALDTLLGAGLAGETIYLAKLLSAFVQLLGLYLLLLLGSTVIDNLSLPGSIPLLLAAGAAGCLVLAAAGTFLGGLTSSLRGRQAVLPLLFFPVALPALLAAVRLTTSVLDPMQLGPGELGQWLTVLGVATVLWMVGGALLYLPAIEP